MISTPNKSSFAKARFFANHLDARESISQNTQVTFTDERVKSFLMLTNFQSSRLEQIHEGSFVGAPVHSDGLLNENAPAYPRLM
jgi:hypothetical protein